MAYDKPPSMYVAVVDAMFRTLAPVSVIIIAMALIAIFMRMDAITNTFQDTVLKNQEGAIKTLNLIKESQEEIRKNQVEIKRNHEELERLRKSVKPEVK